MNQNTEKQEELIEIDNIIPFPFKIRLECPECRGVGLVTTFAGRVSGQHKCPRCEGSGKIGAK